MHTLQLLSKDITGKGRHHLQRKPLRNPPWSMHIRGLELAGAICHNKRQGVSLWLGNQLPESRNFAFPVGSSMFKSPALSWVPGMW